MKKYSDFQNNPWLIHILALGILFLGVWRSLFPVANGFFNDSFHHGEYVASLQSVLEGKMDFLTLHGALDWIPAWVAQQAFGGEKYFLATGLIYSFLSALSGLFLYFIIALQTGRDSHYRAIVMMASSVWVIYLVGYRDVFLLLTILIYFLCEKCSSQRGRNLLELLLGMSLAVNLFWSFDRGVAGIAGIGLACLSMGILERRYLFSMASFVASLMVMKWMGVLSFSAYVENLGFLLATSSQWSYGYSVSWAISNIALVAVPNGWAIYYLLKQLYPVIRTDLKEAAPLFLLLTLCILMLKIGTNRADASHVVMTLWMPALAFFYLREKYPGKTSFVAHSTIAIAIIWMVLNWSSYWLSVGVGAIVPVIYAIEIKYPRFAGNLALQKIAVVMFAIPLLYFNVTGILSNYSHGRYLWVSNVSAPPNNRLLVDKSIQWVSSELLTSGSHCVFDLSNNGVINGITGLSACTKYTYPVYATPRYEADMLKQLQERNPPAVVFSSTYWSFWEDGKSMHGRYPKLTDYLLKAYPFEKCSFGYCLRYVNEPA